jgi:hypothetical protein
MLTYTYTYTCDGCGKQVTETTSNQGIHAPNLPDDWPWARFGDEHPQDPRHFCSTACMRGYIEALQEKLAVKTSLRLLDSTQEG